MGAPALQCETERRGCAAPNLGVSDPACVQAPAEGKAAVFTWGLAVGGCSCSGLCRWKMGGEGTVLVVLQKGPSDAGTCCQLKP